MKMRRRKLCVLLLAAVFVLAPILHYVAEFRENQPLTERDLKHCRLRICTENEPEDSFEAYDKDKVAAEEDVEVFAEMCGRIRRLKGMEAAFYAETIWEAETKCLRSESYSRIYLCFKKDNRVYHVDLYDIYYQARLDYIHRSRPLVGIVCYDGSRSGSLSDGKNYGHAHGNPDRVWFGTLSSQEYTDLAAIAFEYSKRR